jgi:hypothetical protein
MVHIFKDAICVPATTAYGLLESLEKENA